MGLRSRPHRRVYPRAHARELWPARQHPTKCWPNRVGASTPQLIELVNRYIGPSFAISLHSRTPGSLMAAYAQTDDWRQTLGYLADDMRERGIDPDALVS